MILIRLIRHLFPIEKQGTDVNWHKFNVIDALYMKTIDMENNDMDDMKQASIIKAIKTKIIAFYETNGFSEQLSTSVNPNLFGDPLFVEKCKDIFGQYTEHEMNDWCSRYWNKYGMKGIVDVFCKCELNGDIFCGLFQYYQMKLSNTKIDKLDKWVDVIEFILSCISNSQENKEKQIKLVMIAQKEIEKCLDLIEENIVKNRMENAFESLEIINGQWRVVKFYLFVFSAYHNLIQSKYDKEEDNHDSQREKDLRSLQQCFEKFNSEFVRSEDSSKWIVNVDKNDMNWKIRQIGVFHRSICREVTAVTRNNNTVLDSIVTEYKQMFGIKFVDEVKDEKKEDDEYDNDDNDERRISNALVLIICISQYNQLDNLESVKVDMKIMRDLWEKRFNYTVIANEISKKDNEYFVDAETIDSKIGDAKKLLRDENNTFDGFILIYSGHGYKDGIITSDNQYVKLTEIQKEFSAKKLKKFKDYPKIFIIDACRSRFPSLPMEERLEIKGASNKKYQTQWYHPLANMIEIFGNTRGYGVGGNPLTGGSLIREMSNTFENYILKNERIFDKKTFQQLFNPIKKSLHHNQHGNQVVKIEDTLIGIDVFISPRKHENNDN